MGLRPRAAGTRRHDGAASLAAARGEGDGSTDPAPPPRASFSSSFAGAARRGAAVGLYSERDSKVPHR